MIDRKKYRSINTSMLIKTMGWLVMMESAFMCIPMIVSICFGESDWQTFFYCTLMTLGVGYAMNEYTQPSTKTMGKREGFLLTALVWIVFSAFGMLPFIFCDNSLSVTDAFTEAMSGFTTTGATIINDVESLSHGVKVWRSLMQWIGGMGIILFTLAVIPVLNHSGGLQMFNAEVTGITHGKLRPRISQTAKTLWSIYILLTILCIALLWIGPLDIFEAFTHGLSTIATGGFSIYNDGIEHYGSNYVKVVTTVFMFLASINFAMIFAMAHRRYKVLKSEEPFKVFVCIIFVASVIVLISQYIHGCVNNWGDSVVDTLFMVVSAFSSTSYVSEGIEHWGSVALGLLIIMIFIGGCAGSTAGGAKIDRIIVLAKYMRNEIKHAVQPNSILSVRMNKKNMPIELVEKVIAFLALYLMIILGSTLILSMMDITLTDSLFTSITCISNSGTCVNFGQYGGALVAIPAAGKIMLAFVMLTGRLGIYTILVLFTASFWRK